MFHSSKISLLEYSVFPSTLSPENTEAKCNALPISIAEMFSPSFIFEPRGHASSGIVIPSGMLDVNHRKKPHRETHACPKQGGERNEAIVGAFMEPQPLSRR